jgi:O-antigen ligase
MGLTLGLAAVALARRSRGAWLAVALAAVAFGVLSAIQPFSRSGFQPQRLPPAAEFQLQFNRVAGRPLVSSVIPIVVRNSGATEWRDIRLVALWYEAETRRALSLPLPSASIPRLSVGESVAFDVPITTPAQPGHYLLAFSVMRDSDWLSETIVPGVVEVEITPHATTRFWNAGYRYWKPGSSRILDASVNRLTLWKAAWRLFRERPLAGIGPDNFRLRYGRVLGYDRWDTNIRANNLYLELLTGAGVAGLIVFGAMLVALRWSIQPASTAVVVFLAHGLVDSFLMTTPIYLSFWVLLGQVHARR